MPPITHSVLGASAAERWIHCPPSARLTAGMQDEETSFAAEGTAAHALCEWKVRRVSLCQSLGYVYDFRTCVNMGFLSFSSL